MYLRRLYDLPVLSVAGTLSITSGGVMATFFNYKGCVTPILPLATASHPVFSSD
ncbi:hypothetical protein A1122_14225 [Yersinia pestis A1122]|uniref:Uncharacterized protein n=1 Tax=Yersinia pseudotuberculosis serotype O:3 (strain YPIII) TaxID=502800 RepID=A0A0H3B2R6_YERPY|nr:hypothetical protein A1122_14225 [Yersinia pestis A1122]